MIQEYRYKNISKAIQILVTYYSKNKDRKNQMICCHFQGALNEYMEKAEKEKKKFETGFDLDFDRKGV